MSELVKRLRTWESGSANQNLTSYAQIFSVAADRIEKIESALKRLGSKESMTLQAFVGVVDPKFDYRKEYFTRIEYAQEAIK